jgi:hypothetical protein
VCAGPSPALIASRTSRTSQVSAITEMTPEAAAAALDRLVSLRLAAATPQVPPPLSCRAVGSLHRRLDAVHSPGWARSGRDMGQASGPGGRRGVLRARAGRDAGGGAGAVCGAGVDRGPRGPVGVME